MRSSVAFATLLLVSGCGDGGPGDASDASDATAPTADAVPAFDAPTPATDAPAPVFDSAPPPDAPLPIDAGPSGIVAATYAASPDFQDAVLDTERHRVYLSYLTGTVEVVDLTDGGVTTLTTGFQPRMLAFEPVHDRVVLTMDLDTPGDNGYVAAIDAVTPVDPLAWPIAIRPRYVTCDASGFAFVFSSDGADGVNLDLSTGSADFTGEPYGRSRLVWHPDFDRFYGLADNKIQRYEVVGHQMFYRYEGPDTATGSCEELRMHPDGTYIYSACGEYFYATNTFGTDGSLAGFLGPPWLDLAFHRVANRIYTVADGATAGRLNVYDATTHAPLPYIPLSAAAQRLFSGTDYLVVVRSLAGPPAATQLETIPFTELTP